MNHLFLLLALALQPFDADQPTPEVPGFGEQWRFALTTNRPPYVSDACTTVQIPHTWNSVDALNGGGKDTQSRDGFHRGAGWYEKRFRVPNHLQGKRLFLRFEGVGSVANVYLNDRHLGEHRGAFGAFCFEITEHCLVDAENTLAVRVDNSWRKDLAPLSGDFPVFGGIYRPVTLFGKSSTCIDPLDYASPGVYVTQHQVSRENAEISVVTKLSSVGAAATVTVDCEILDANGSVVVGSSESTRIIELATVRHDLSIIRPRLWHGRRDPYLYTVRIKLRQGDTVLDECRQPLGLRSIRIDPVHGFFLNEEPYKLYGVNRHQDRSGKGWALSNDDHREDIRLIEDIGARGLRLAHYPHAAEVYELCDKKGLLVWAELPIVDCITAGDAFAANAKEQLREMIRQHYNHPSIFCWSLFNEMYHRESADFSRLLEELHALSKQEDLMRLTAGATNKERPALCRVTDALAFNKYPGWYGGNPDGMSKWLDRYNEVGGRRGIAVSEYGAGASIRQHEQEPEKAAPKSRWHPEEWQAIVHEGNYSAIRQADYCWGSFVWNMFDFASVWRDEGDATGMNDKGLVTYDRKVRKDAFYFYKANWSDDPVLRITSRRHKLRRSPATQVKVYTNATQASLFVNGESLGERRPSENHVAIWEAVPLRPGVNEIRVEAMREGVKLMDSCEWRLVESGTPQPSAAADEGRDGMTSGSPEDHSAASRGIAARYPGDVGIESDSDVVAAYRFESDSWREDDDGRTRVSAPAGGLFQTPVSVMGLPGFAPFKGRALAFRVDRGGHYGGSFSHYFASGDRTSEPEAVGFRYYLRFGDDWDGSGGKLPGFGGTYDIAGWGGKPSDGTNGWSARGSFSRLPDGRVQIGSYCYHAEMTSDYGSIWRWDLDDAGVLERNRWYCIEQHLRLNTPGRNDGIIRGWVDGRLAIDRRNIRFRDSADLRIERIWCNVYHGGKIPAASTDHLFIDNLVIAKSYIGPIVPVNANHD